MKRIQIVTVIIAAIAAIGIGIWYVITDMQTVKKNKEQINSTSEAEAADSMDNSNMPEMEH